MAALLTRDKVVAHAKALQTASAASIFEIGFFWLQIIAALMACSLYPRWWTYAAAFVFISTRQYGLAILLHDAQHSRLHPNRTVSDWLGRWLVAAPLGSEFAASQKSHLAHHGRFGNPDGDPDYALYCFGRPAPKQSARQIAAFFIGRLFGGQIAGVVRKADAMEPSSAAPEAVSLAASLSCLARRLWTVVCVQLGLLAALTWAFGWWGYPVLWALPLATLAVFYNDFRIFCEHSLAGRDATVKDERLISFISNPVERFFFAPAHMNYHAEHHMFAYVPHRNLPALRQAIMACPEMRERIVWRSSYCGHLVAYLRDLRVLQSQTPTVGVPAQPATHGRSQWA